MRIGLVNQGTGQVKQVGQAKQVGQVRQMGRALFLGVVTFLLCFHSSYAGVFNIQRFVAPGLFAVGLEPELNFNGGVDTGVNLRYTHGLTDINNLSGILGTGSGNRQFRFGGAYSFDFFPDAANQPGIGLAIQALFVQLPRAGSLEITGIPYFHKMLKLNQLDIDPFIAIPVGLSLSQGSYQSISTLVLGNLFHHGAHIKTVVELGLPLGNSSAYFSGGIVYYH